MVEVYVIEIPEKIEINFLKEKLYNSIFASKTVNIPKEVNRHQLISMLAHAFVQKIVCEKLGLDETIPVLYTEQGKPFFTNLPNMHFNISHSGSYICIAIARNPVGVDIERTRICKQEVVKRFFHSKETEDVLKIQDESLRNIYFSKLWSLKESYVKFTGSGIANAFNTFFIQINTHNNIQIVGNTENVYFKSYNCFNQVYQLSVCSLTPVFQDKPQFLFIKDL